MIYQRSSTAFELITLDEEENGCESNANTTVTPADAIIDWHRKISRKQKQRNSKATISSLSNVNFKDSKSDFENLFKKQSQFKQKKKIENNLSLTKFASTAKKSCQQNLNNSNKKIQFENSFYSNKSNIHFIEKKLDQIETNNLQPLNYFNNSNIINYNQKNDTFDLIKTNNTSISELIVDDYDKDKNLFAMFNTIKNYSQYQNYYTNCFQQQKQNNKKKINIDFDQNNKNVNNEQNLLNELQSCNNYIISNNLDKLEQYERDDQIGEMIPKNFSRKKRRVCFYKNKIFI